MIWRAGYLFVLLGFHNQINAAILEDCHKLSVADEKVTCLERAAADQAFLIANMPSNEFSEEAKKDILKWEAPGNLKSFEFNKLTLHEGLDERTICGEIKVPGNTQASRFIKSFDLKTNSFRSTWFPNDNPENDLNHFKLGLFETQWSVRCVNANSLP
jgi:hypothetical protein